MITSALKWQNWVGVRDWTVPWNRKYFCLVLCRKSAGPCWNIKVSLCFGVHMEICDFLCLPKTLGWILPHFLKDSPLFCFGFFLSLGQPTVIHSWLFFMTSFAYFPVVPFASQVNRLRPHRSVVFLKKLCTEGYAWLGHLSVCCRNLDLLVIFPLELWFKHI